METKAERITNLVNELVKEVGPLEVVNVLSKTEVRIWKLGSCDHKIFPTQQAIDHLADLLNKHLPKDGTVNIIWGPDLQVQVIK